jgi:hypothetical protein
MTRKSRSACTVVPYSLSCGQDDARIEQQGLQRMDEITCLSEEIADKIKPVQTPNS